MRDKCGQTSSWKIEESVEFYTSRVSHKANHVFLWNCIVLQTESRQKATIKLTIVIHNILILGKELFTFEPSTSVSCTLMAFIFCFKSPDLDKVLFKLHWHHSPGHSRVLEKWMRCPGAGQVQESDNSGAGKALE